MNTPRLPTVVLVGRANVGKSTLFNRLLEKKAALVSNIPGTTRDRKEGVCLWRGRVITVVDTGGLDVKGTDEIEVNMVKQAERAMELADIILFVVDVEAGPLPHDHELAAELKRGKKPVFVVANKADKMSLVTSVYDKEWRLGGLPTPIPVSAVKGTGTGDLLELIYEKLTELGKPPQPMSAAIPTRIAVIGRPNVGKSSLLNAVLGEERFIASSIAHTTREPNDVLVEVENRQYVLADTAGIRKMNRVRREGGLEFAGVERTKRLLEQTDVALFVVDASEPISSQDRTLAGLLKSSKVGIIIVVNKWDLIGSKTPATMNEFKRQFHAYFPFLTWAPLMFVSAKSGQRVPNIFAEVDKVQTRRFRELTPEEMDATLRRAITKHPPTRAKGPAPPKILGMAQTHTAPPTFSLTVKTHRLDVLAESWIRFLEHQLRDHYDFEGTPIRIDVQKPRAGTQ